METLINHPVVDPVPKYWIGCPISPEFLSDTLLSTVNAPPFSFIEIGFALVASLKVFASWMLTFVVNPVARVFASVIAKYTVLASSPSGIWPVSLVILIVSPFANVCGEVKLITLSTEPILNLPILLIPDTLLWTSKDFIDVDYATEIQSVVLEPSMTILALYVSETPLVGIKTFRLSLDFAPTRYPSRTSSGGTSIFVAP